MALAMRCLALQSDVIPPAGDLTSMLVSTPCLAFFSVVALAMTWGAQQKPCCTPRTTMGTPSLQTSWKILRHSTRTAQPADKVVLPGTSWDPFERLQ